MRFPTLTTCCLLAVSLAANACGESATPSADDDLGDELPSDDGKLDSFKRPTDHGFLPYEVAATAEFSKDARVHAYEFTVDATVNVTAKAESTGDVDVYLYRRTGSGTWRKVGRADAVDETTWAEQPEYIAELEHKLTAGTYRVITTAKAEWDGHSARTALSCEGRGCPREQCLFQAAVEPFPWNELSVLPVVKTEVFDRDHEIPEIIKAQFVATAEARSLEAAWAETYEDLIVVTTTRDPRTEKEFVQIYFEDLEIDPKTAFFAVGDTTVLARSHAFEFSACSLSW